MNKLLRARAYIRVSLVGKARKDNLLSDAMQLDAARKYAEYEGMQFDEEASTAHADLDVSGFRKSWRQRPGLMAHYEAAKRREFDCLIFYKISRLARNVREALDMIEAFEKLGVSFHFVAEKIDSTSAQGRFLRNVLLSAAEMQSEDTSAFLKSACERRAKEGRLQGATPAWIRKVDKRYELIPEQVDAMRRLIDLRLQGTAYPKIAKRLNEEGYRTVQGKYWTMGMAFKYLSPTYVETMLGTGFYGRHTKEPIRIPNALPPIITQSEADRLLAIQKLYSEQYTRSPMGGMDWVSNKRKSGRRSAGTVHLLSGIVFCPYCGARLVAKAMDKRNRFVPFNYACPNAPVRPDVHFKGLKSINAASLEDAVLRVLRAVLVLPPPPVPSKPTKKKVADADAVQARIDRLVNLHLDDKIGDSDFNRIYVDLVAEKERLQVANAVDVLPEHHAQAMELAGKEELTREELRQLVLLMVEKVEAPVTMPGITIRVDRKTLRRLAKVRLRFPTSEGVLEFLAGIYENDFEGVRRHVEYRQDGLDDLTQLIGERPSQRQK